MTASLPLFPLHTVLFPGGVLPLRIFEARYLDMVSRCLGGSGPFGVCLIISGSEAGEPAECATVGTSALIEDFSRTPEGLLAITARGQRRFRVHSRRVGRDNLVSADVEWLPAPVAHEVPSTYRHLQRFYRDLASRAGTAGVPAEDRSSDADWLSCRIVELLPLEADVKQRLLEDDDGLARLKHVDDLLQALIPESRRGGNV